MLKFFSTLAIASMSLTAFAAGNFEDYVVTPSEGNVESLQRISVFFPNLEDLDLLDGGSITVNYNGTTNLSIRAGYDGPELTVRIVDAVSQPGTYVLTVPAGSICGYDESYNVVELTSDITATWSIGGSQTGDAFSYSVAPAEGEVSELSKIELTFPNIYDLDINSKDDIVLTRDGVVISGVSSPEPDDNVLSLTLGTPAVEPGEYVLTIGEYALSGFSDSWDYLGDNESKIELKWTIASKGMNFSHTSVPEEGVVEELSEIKVTFPTIYELDINTKSDVNMLFNGEPMAEANISASGNVMTVKFNETQTAKGKYTLSILPYAICGYNETYEEYADNEEAIELNWTIAGAADELDFTPTAEPSTEGVYLSIPNVAVTFPELESVTVNEMNTTVMFDGHAIYGYTLAVENNTVKIDFTSPVEVYGDEATTLNVVFKEDALTGTKGGVTNTNKDLVSVIYTLAPAVTYDLTLSLSSPTDPNANGEISANKQLDAFYFSAEGAGLLPAAGEEENVVIRSLDGSYEVAGHLKKANGLNSSRSYFRIDTGVEPVYNGKYEIVISKASFGDEYWQANPECGRSNEQITLNFTLVDGVEVDIYTIETVSVAPEAGNYQTGAEIAEITLTFDADVEAVAGASAMLGGVDVSDYMETATFASAGAGTYVARFPAPTSKGTYRFTVEPGMFGDAKFIAGEAGGKGSKAISLEYVISENSGVDAISAAETAAEVYDLNGLRIEKEVNALPAGIYIINGKKIVKK